MEGEAIPILLLGNSDVGKSLFLSRLTVLKYGPNVERLPQLRDTEQPFVFDVTVSRKSHTLEFYDTASSTSYLLVNPAVLVLCFSIADRSSLSALRTEWKDTVERHFNYNDNIPVIVLGLKRDLRREDDPESVFPHEGAVTAQAMRCDKYCECSALTGELVHLVFKDIAETAAMTTTEAGGRTPGPSCSLM